MHIHILKTDLEDSARVSAIEPILNLHPLILRWNVDNDDIDNVLRIEAKLNLSEEETLKMLKQHGVYCESLPD